MDDVKESSLTEFLEELKKEPIPCIRCGKKMRYEEAGGSTIMADAQGFSIFFLCENCVKVAPKGSEERERLKEEFSKERDKFLEGTAPKG